MSQLTPDQLDQLKSLGIFVDPVIKPQSKLKINTPQSSSRVAQLTPIFAIVGITTLTLSGVIFLKSNNSDQKQLTASVISPSPTKVQTTTNTETIQSSLLLSQQYFTKALQAQQSQTNNQQVIGMLNQAIDAASTAIKNYPNDYRGYYQRGKIYQSLIDSKPEFTDATLSDFQKAYSLNSSSAEISRNLASVYARKGDSINTIAFLYQTTNLEPTKAQNFYDLAKIQQQTGHVADALSTYNRLLPLLSDPAQLASVQAEKSALEQIISSNPSLNQVQPIITTSPSIPPVKNTDTLIQASNSTGLIIASPETKKNIEVNNITSSNSLSGTATLPANQKDIVLNNSQLQANSQVYVTILKGGKNQNLQVTSKSGSSFVVGLDSPITENIEFKWWIIN